MNSWSGLVIVAAIGLLAWIASVLSASANEKKLIQSGILPDSDNTTDSDIKRLALSGHKVWAIKRYRELHKASLKEAKQRVEAMQE